MKPNHKPAKAGAPLGHPASEPNAPPKVRILIVDDHPVTRDGIKAMINLEPNLEVCGETDNAAHARELAVRHNPDVAIVDIALKTMDGIELTKHIIVEAPKVRVLVVSFHDEMIYAERALRAGAKGYLMKHEACEKIIAAIRQVLQGLVYVSDPVKEKMLNELVDRRDRPQFAIDLLSDREMEVFHLIGNGFSTRQIARKFGLTTKTIDSYREHLKTKLNLASRSDLVRHAIHWTREHEGLQQADNGSTQGEP